MSDEKREQSVNEPDEEAERTADSPEPGAGSAKAKKGAKAKSKPVKTRAIESVKDRNQRIREEAAAKRRDRRDDERRRAAPARNLDASEIVDDALARGTHNVAVWLKEHVNILQWVAVLLIVGGIGYKVYSLRHERTIGKASDKLLAAIEAESARVGEGSAEPDRYTGLVDTRKQFKSDEERLKSAAAAYQAAIDNGASLGTLAKLGQAGIFYDLSKYKESLSAYQAVRDSDLASKDQDVKGRAIEGMALSQEGLGNVDEALKSFRELENSGISGFGALAQYHQARLFHQKGDNVKAKELISKALEKLDEKARTPNAPPGYLQSAAHELLGAIDP
ncbi:MAG TPA: hypothetical protein VGP93_12755, partial [Polyangiaceae bacterium]|nr:hypothetical protein [Polyangiaceae bacterium]